MMSGGPIEKFSEGWALQVLPITGSRRKAHYFKREGVGPAIPICSSVGIPAGALRGAGNWTKCTRCELKAGEANVA